MNFIKPGDRIKFIKYPPNPDHIYRRELELNEVGTVKDVSHLGYWVNWDSGHKSLWMSPEFVRQVSLTEKKFPVITLCGSTKFKDEYIKTNIALTMEGYVVLACPIFHHADGLDISEEEGSMLRELHKQRIDMSSEIYVINKDGYIGDWTREEIEYATKTGKTVLYMVDPNITSSPRLIQLWVEGFHIQGGESTARFLGEYEADNLRDAVIQYMEKTRQKSIAEVGPANSTIDLDRLTDWGCRFFDNEADARKSFG